MVLIPASMGATYEFACRTKACAPPPVGSGGSSPTGGSSYASNKLKKAGAAGDTLSIEWAKSEGNDILRGVVTTAGGRKFAVAWDEFDIGPKAADQIIKQYGKLLDIYPDAPAVPLAMGLDAAQEVFARVFSDDPFYKGQVALLHNEANGYVVNDNDTKAPLMMGFSNKMDGRKLMVHEENWGEGAFKLSTDRAREYIVTHEFGHVVQQHALSKMTPGKRAVSMIQLDVQIEDAQRRGVSDIGKYALSRNVELFAESFAVQSHGLATSRDASFLRDVTDPYLAGEAPRRVEWTS